MGMMSRVSWLAVVVSTIALAPSPTDAHHSASRSGPLQRERYLVCARPDAIDRVECVGPERARSSLLRQLALGDLVDRKNLDYWIEPAHTAAVWSAYFNVRDAIAPLRTWLTIRLDASDAHSHLMFDKQGLRGEAAFALAKLGDKPSAPAIAALLRELETTGVGSIWSETLAALTELDPARASAYALDFLARTTDFKMSLPGGSSKLLALDAIRVDDAARAKPVLAKLAQREEHGYDHAYCEIMATRVRIDPAVHVQARELFVKPYSGTWLAGCAESVIARMGTEILDVDALVRHLGRPDTGIDFGMTNLGYLRMLELEIALAQRRDQSADDVRTILRAGLGERSTWPFLADPTSSSYAPHFAAFHAAALAGVGDGAAGRRLEMLVDDPADTSGVAWLASLYDLKLGRPGSVDRAARLIARGIAYDNREHTGVVYAGVRTRVLDAFVARAPDDGRWAVAVLDRDPDTHEHALELISRLHPRGACEAVTSAARRATGHAAEFGFLALTAYGTACIPALDGLATSKDLSPDVRGAAIEMLAGMQAPSVCDRLQMAADERVPRPATERARHLASCATIGR